MKKHNLYFMLTVLLAGLFASCSQEDMDGLQTNEPTSVTLSANVNGGIQTRAGTIPNQYKLRYILEVWTTGDSPVLKYREEQIKTDFSGVDFTFGLTDAGNYNALLWADFLHNNYTSTTSKVTISGFECDHYTDHNYKTTDNLKNITRTPGGNAPYQGFDAFCACHPISKTTGAYSGNVQLVRPFGQINIIEKDADALAKVDQTNAVFKVPKGYNIENGMPTSTTEEANMCMATIMWEAYHDCTANLYYDYIFAPSTGQTTLGEIALSFEVPDNMKNTYQIADFTIPANMPVVRNKRTNISGHIVSVSDAPSPTAKLSVTVSDGWTTPGEDIELPSVGDYFYSDGTFSSTEQAGKTLTGIVFWTNPDNRGKGKIVSLDQIGHLDQSGKGVIWTDAQNTTSANPLPEGMTWRLPTKVELQHLWCAYNGAEPTTWVLTKDAPQKNTTANAAFGSKLTGKFGSYYYWSSEEDADNTDNAWNMTFNNGNTESSKKTRQNRVRWVSDF